jgi:hypothetical protein
MIHPGTYRTTETTTIELCQRNGEREPRIVEYTTYEPGEEFTIPRSVNQHFYRLMFDREERKPMGRYERVQPAEAP